MTWEEHEVLQVIRRLRRRDLGAWMEAGWVRPAESDRGRHFDETDIARLRLICDLRQTCGVPQDAVPMVLSLVDQVHGLRRHLRSVLEAIERQPEPTRRAILRSLRSGGDKPTDQ